MTMVQRLEQYSTLDDDSGCWMWQRANNGIGYGVVFYRGRQSLAHRVSYELLVGPIPAGLVIDHLCRRPGCINPEHLEPVTHRENTLRGIAFAAVNAAKTHCPQGHEYDYIDPKGARQCRVCRRQAMFRYRARKRNGLVGT